MTHALDGGRIVLVEHRDGFWRGHTREGRAVVAALKPHRNLAELQALLAYDVPGIAPLVFIGPAEDGDVAVVEEQPAGGTLAHAPASSVPATIGLGIDLCAMAMAWAERREDLTSGIRPETVYLDGDRFTGATPRVELFQGRHSDHFEAPADGIGSYTADDLGFVIARILWIALLREDPYRLPEAPNDLENIWRDRRRPWTGPPALGALLERVLVANGRLPLADFAAALRAMT